MKDNLRSLSAAEVGEYLAMLEVLKQQNERERLELRSAFRPDLGFHREVEAHAYEHAQQLLVSLLRRSV